MHHDHVHGVPDHHVHEWERLRGLGGEEKDGAELKKKEFLLRKYGCGLRTDGREPEVFYEVLAALKIGEKKMDKTQSFAKSYKNSPFFSIRGGCGTQNNVCQE